MDGPEPRSRLRTAALAALLGWVRFDGATFSAHGGCNDFGGEFTSGWTAIKTSATPR